MAQSVQHNFSVHQFKPRFEPTPAHDNQPSIRPKSPITDPINTDKANITSRRIDSHIVFRRQVPIIRGAKPPRRRITRVRRIRFPKVDLEAETRARGRVEAPIGDALGEARCRNDGLRNADVEIIGEEDGVRELERGGDGVL